MEQIKVIEVKEIIGKKMFYHQIEGEMLRIYFTDHTRVEFYHEQDCCEVVEIVDLNVLGKPDTKHEIVSAYITYSHTENIENSESSTFSFLNIIFSNGAVINLQFRGESNGYYNESIDYKIYQ